MKQFRTIFGFEYLSYAKNKVFVGLTALLIAVMAVVLFYPRFAGDKHKRRTRRFRVPRKTLPLQAPNRRKLPRKPPRFCARGFVSISLPRRTVTRPR